MFDSSRHIPNGGTSSNYFHEVLNQSHPGHIALACASFGWPVLPLNRVTANPAMPGWPELATTNPELIKWWWDANGPWAGRLTGILTGRRANFWALDVDDKNGKSGSATLAHIEAEHGPLPRTWKLKTPSGLGYQLWFEYPSDHEIQSDSQGSLLGSGLDVKGWHSMVRAPLTLRTHGTYKILDNARPVRAPGWLEDRLRRSSAPLALDADEYWEPIDLDDWVELAGDVAGYQESYLFRGICSMRGRSASREEMITGAWAAASRFTNTRPHQPWTHEEIVKKVDYIRARYAAGRGVNAVMQELLKGILL